MEFFTLGHSTRPIDEFVDMLQDAGADFVVDIRSFPRSRTNPAYNAGVLPASLAEYGVGYEHIAALGGRRGKAPETPVERNAFWRNRSFHNYADYALSDEFSGGLLRLLKLGSAHKCAMMCAEAVWWRCHRRIVADYLLSRGHKVTHLLAPGDARAGELTPAARTLSSGGLVYPAGEQAG